MLCIPALAQLCCLVDNLEVGVYRIVTWSRDKTSQTRGVNSFALSDDGQTLTYTQIGETTMASNPMVDSLRQTIKNEKKLAETLERMGLKAGSSTTYYTNSYVYERVGS